MILLGYRKKKKKRKQSGLSPASPALGRGPWHVCCRPLQDPPAAARCWVRLRRGGVRHGGRQIRRWRGAQRYGALDLATSSLDREALSRKHGWTNNGAIQFFFSTLNKVVWLERLWQDMYTSISTTYLWSIHNHVSHLMKTNPQSSNRERRKSLHQH